jgi:hypothetical protein
LQRIAAPPQLLFMCVLTPLFFRASLYRLLARLDEISLLPAAQSEPFFGLFGLSGRPRGPLHKRRRHETNDIGNATNGSSAERQKRQKKGETGDDKCRQTTRPSVQREGGNSSGNGGAGGSSDDSSNVGASSAGRDKEIVAEAGRRGL